MGIPIERWKRVGCVTFLVAAWPMALLAQAAPATKALDFVLIGDPGAPAEPTTGVGRVNTTFRMGRYEISNAQYAQFLNAVANQADPHRLWHRNQAEGPMGFIQRLSNDGQYL
jgi:hypothetical protein